MADRPVALITGASSGIGAAFARQFAARQYDVVLVARRRERLEELAREVGDRQGIRAEALAADLASESGMHAVEERIRGEARLELLVNNAGFGTRRRFHENELETQDQMTRLHVLATMRLSHAALLGMVARGHGGIINVSSLLAFAQSPSNVCYGATKAWMNSFSEGLFLEMKSLGSAVKIQVLCPGFTATGFHDVMGVHPSQIPGVFWMDAEEVVAASLKGLDRGKLLVIPGWKNKTIAWLQRNLPDPLKRNAMMKGTGKFRRAARAAHSALR